MGRLLLVVDETNQVSQTCGMIGDHNFGEVIGFYFSGDFKNHRLILGKEGEYDVQAILDEVQFKKKE